MASPLPVPNHPPPPRAMSGCLIALLVFGAGALILAALMAFAVYRFAHSEQGQRIFAAIGEAKDLYDHAAHAPGVKEAEEKGCIVALVFDLRDLEMLAQMFAEATGEKMGELPQQLTLFCAVGTTARNPRCQELATVYRSAPGASADPLLVVVYRQGDEGPACQEVYDVNGTPLPDAAGPS